MATIAISAPEKTALARMRAKTIRSSVAIMAFGALAATVATIGA
jgi:hypothetical protein